MADGGMYALNPVFNLDASVDLPTCMYSLPVIQCSKSISGDGGDCPPAVLKALEARQEAILAKLGHLRDEVKQYRKSIGLPTETKAPSSTKVLTSDVVVRCSPSHPPFSLPGLLSILSSQVGVYSSVHSHSSVSNLPAHLASFLPAPSIERGAADLKITLIWKEVGSDCELMVSPISQSVIKGEVNLIRFLARMYPGLLSYESEQTATAVDNILDSVTSLLWAQPKERQPILRPLAVNLGKHEFLCGAGFGVADLALFSALKKLNLDRDLQPELRKWFTLVSTKLMAGKGRRRSRASSSRKSFNKRRASERKNSEKRADKENVAPKKSAKNDNKKSIKTPGKESSPPKSVTMSAHMSKAELHDYLTANGINFDNVDHPAVLTVEAMMPHVKHLDGAICKNLFLKDKQKNYYLLSAKYDRDIKLNELSKSIGAKELRFGQEEDMFNMLGVKQGCVTAYALVNDKEKRVKFLVDKQLVDGSHDHVSFHPMVNTATTKISSKDFNKFLYLTKHNVIQF